MNLLLSTVCRRERRKPARPPVDRVSPPETTVVESQLYLHMRDKRCGRYASSISTRFPPLSKGEAMLRASHTPRERFVPEGQRRIFRDRQRYCSKISGYNLPAYHGESHPSPACARSAATVGIESIVESVTTMKLCG